MFARLSTLLGHPEWPSDPRFVDATARVRHRDALIARIEAITAGHPRAHWIAALDAAGIPCGPINSYAEAFADPQVRARGMVVEIEHPTQGTVRMPAPPVKMSETPPRVSRRAPLLGEHTREVLGEAGCTDAEIARAGA